MSNRPSSRRSRTASRPGARLQPRAGAARWILVAVACAVLGAAAIALALTWSTGSFEYGSPEVRGDALAGLGDPGAPDPAVGQPAPEVLGADHDGTPVSIAADGRPKVVIFLAHWCPHCQREVPVVQDWIDANGMPSDVDLVSVSTRFQPNVEEWPPDEWLESEGWSVPVIVDDEEASVATAFGLSGTPMYVAVGADGTVVARQSGEIGGEGLAALIEVARAGGTPG